MSIYKKKIIKLTALAVLLVTELSAFGYSEKDLDQLLTTNSCPGCDLSNADLHLANLSKVNLVGANLSGADLGGALLGMADLEGADLRNSDLRGAVLEAADLFKADLSGAALDGVNLDGAYLAEAKISETHKTPSSAKLQSENKGNESQSKTLLIEKDGQGLEKDESASSLAQHDALAKRSQPANKIDKELKTAHVPLKKFELGESENKEKKGKGDVLQKDMASPKVEAETHPSVTVSKLGNKDEAVKKLLESSKCLECDLAGVDLSGKKLKQAYLERAILVGANLAKADLRGANLKGANLMNANLRGANLEDADLYMANLAGVDFSNANLKGVALDGAYTVGAVFDGAQRDNE